VASALPKKDDMKLLDETARGVYVIAVTPFTEEGALDLSSVATMVDFYIAAGADGLTLLGVLGEAPKLTADESAAFVKAVVDAVDGRVPVIVGVSASGLAALAWLAQAAMAAGAAGVMVAPPPTLRTDDQIFDYYRLVGEALGDVPFALQDHPQSTGVQMSTGVILRIIDAVPTCVMVKHEDWPGLQKLDGLRAASASGRARRVSILGGNGALFLPEELDRGSDGAMTGFAFPEMMVAICRAHAAGERGRMLDVFDAYLPLARYEQQPGIGLAIRKLILSQRGAIASPTVRKPGPRVSTTDIADIARLIERLTTRLEQLG
jgi:4-hydroxy-tetrahydrodipicolinate synthase